MPSTAANGIQIEVESHGRPEHPTFLLIRGLGTQLVQWPAAFLAPLVEAGHRVVVFDNRDVGLSQKFDAAGRPDLAAILAGNAEPAYHLADMADDAVAVLDALAIPRAHIVGISMGGMIAQRVAAAHGERCLTLTSIMSSSGAAGLPSGTPEAMSVLTSAPADPEDRECVIRHSMQAQRVIGSPAYPMTEAELRRYCEVAFDRCRHPAGFARQLAAVLCDRGRADLLSKIGVPSLVVHGTADPLVPLECGEDTARRIPGARFEAIEGMGHDVTAANAPLLVRLLLEHARRALHG